jgi:hypothetical protein
MAPVLEGKSIGSNKTNSAKGRTPYLENDEEESRYGPRYSPT